MNQKPKPRHKRKEPLLLAWCVILIAPVLFLAAIAAPVPAGKPASYPAWWFEREVIKRTDTNVTSPLWPTNYLVADDYAGLNSGQLKTLASCAFDELQEKLPYVVWQGYTNAPGVKLSSLVTAWSTNLVSGDNYAGVNQGQLKAVAKYFYDVLGEAGYVVGHGLPPSGWTNGAYPWTASTNAPDAYAGANIGQAKYLFSFDVTVFSSDGDSLPDYWENEEFGNLDSDGDGDFDSDGLTNIEEFQQGTDPQDFFNGQPAVLKIVGGNNQGDLPGTTLSAFKVRVSNQLRTPKPGVNVTFSIQSGGGQLTSANGGTTDASGIAQASLQLPPTFNASNPTVLTQAAFGSVNVTFTATVGDPNAAPAAPSKPYVTLQDGGTKALIEWKDVSNNETAFYVERTDNGTTWERLNISNPLPRNTTSFTDNNLIPGHGYYYRIVVHNEAP